MRQDDVAHVPDSAPSATDRVSEVEGAAALHHGRVLE